MTNTTGLTSCEVRPAVLLSFPWGVRWSFHVISFRVQDCGLIWLWPMTSDAERTHCVTEGAAFLGCICILTGKLLLAMDPGGARELQMRKNQGAHVPQESNGRLVVVPVALAMLTVPSLSASFGHLRHHFWLHLFLYPFALCIALPRGD